MQSDSWSAEGAVPAFTLMMPSVPSVPVVFASPHSGRHYPADFVARSRLVPEMLRRSEDVLVDQLFASVPDHGAPLLAAYYARAYCDLNREPLELDPAMFSGSLPPAANSRSSRVAAGLGTIPRTVGAGIDIYGAKLPVAEIERRLQASYYPYHQQLLHLVQDAQSRFGTCLLVDCHSMPSLGPSVWGEAPVDMVVGDNHGTACDPAITALVVDLLRQRGYKVQLNHPFAGGFTTCQYGRPAAESHALQIEISRSLYLDASGLGPGDGFQPLLADVEVLVQAVTQWMSRKRS